VCSTLVLRAGRGTAIIPVDLVVLRRLGCLLDLGPVTRPQCCAPFRRDTIRVASDLPIDLLSEDFGVAGVTVGLGKDVDRDVEQIDAWLRPPRDSAEGAQAECVDCGISVSTGLSVPIHNLSLGLVGRGPLVDPELSLVVPPR
jgi:hypothetical protein